VSRASEPYGFALIEAIAALALTATLLLALGAITGQWTPAWRHGFARLQAVQSLDAGLDRLAADIAAARVAGPGPALNLAPFVGEPTRIVLVRSQIGPNAGPKLEWVQIEQQAGDSGLIVARSHAPFAPSADDEPPSQFLDAVAALHPPWRVRFAFTGDDGAWRETWVRQSRLPRAVRIEVYDRDSGVASPLSTIVALHVDTPVDCVGKVSVERCFEDLAHGAP